MIIADDSELVAIRKVVRKVLKVDRFSYSEEQGKFYLDPRVNEAMSRTFQFTVDDLIGAEMEQYIYGKYGVHPSKALPPMVMSQMSHNPLTAQQSARIEAKYQEA